MYSVGRQLYAASTTTMSLSYVSAMNCRFSVNRSIRRATTDNTIADYIEGNVRGDEPVEEYASRCFISSTVDVNHDLRTPLHGASRVDPGYGGPYEIDEVARVSG
jgi:hypothetical protein